MNQIDINEHIKIKEKLLKELQEYFEKFIKDERVIIDNTGKKILSGGYGGLSNDAEFSIMISENVLHNYGLKQKFSETIEYERAHYISSTAFKLGRSYAELLEKYYKANN